MSFRLVVRIAALACTCWMSVGAALAENRIALVIGNANYASVSSLPNPANDARAMANFLGEAGFEVLQAADLKHGAMLRTVGKFAHLVEQSGPDTVALLYYAGHGLQVDGENYLVPVDAAIQREADVPLQAMRFGDVMNALSSVPTKALIVMLDACRNNPFAEIEKSAGRGLALVDAPSGSLISYSTAPGTEALDGDGVNSPYTAALLKFGQEEGLPIEQALKRVRLAVNDTTGKQQVPWETSALTSEFSFFPHERGRAGRITMASAPAVDAGTEARAQVRSVEFWQKELKPLGSRGAYDTVIREDKVEAYQAYVLAFPSDPLTAGVRAILDRRQEMIAWNQAVSVNTAESYQAFLARHGNSDFATTAKRLKERPRQRHAALSPAVTRAVTDFAPSPVVVETPVVTPVYTPSYWRFRHRPHEGMGTGQHDRGGKFTKLAHPARISKPIKPMNANRYAMRNSMVNRHITMNHMPTFNRGMSMGFRPSFGGMGHMGGHR
jgi:uncharacterized caspase-like protein